jgi:hypothetical protein
MFAPSTEIIQLLTYFAAAMTAPVFSRMVVLACGTILGSGSRTVASALRAVGLGQCEDFSSYHRVFNGAKWPPLRMSRILLSLVVRFLLPEKAPIVLLVDETLERRRGRKIVYKSWFRDAVRSTAQQVVLSMGIRWLCLAVLVETPWSKRPWALPILLVPLLSEKRCKQLRRRHRSASEWTAELIKRVRRWQPERKMILSADGGFANVSLVRTCQSLSEPVTFVARLRLDAALYDEPEPQPQGKRGRKPKKGARQASLRERLQDRLPEQHNHEQCHAAETTTAWQTVTLDWYGGTKDAKRTLEIQAGRSLWHKQGDDPAPIQWVLARSPQKSEEGSETLEPAAYLCSDPHALPEQVLAWAVGRWNIEVLFHEMREHLGFETQRQWATQAICRTAPCLFGLYTIIVLLAKQLCPDQLHQLPVRQSRWYQKEEATFADVLAAVRRHLWRGFIAETFVENRPNEQQEQQACLNYKGSAFEQDLCLIPAHYLNALQEAACYAS